MRTSALVAALGTAVTTGGAIAALTVLPLHSVSAQSTGTTRTTETTVAAAPAGAAAVTTTTTAPSTRACTSNEDPAHEARETPEEEAAEHAGQCRGGPHDGPGGRHRHGPGGPGFTPNEDPAHEAQESPEREAQEHSSTTTTTVAR